jgi:hypothetical protein
MVTDIDGATRGPESVTVGWSRGLSRTVETIEAAKQTKLGEIWVPELFELEFAEHDPTDPNNPRLVINLLFEVVNEAVQLREVIADPLEVPEALDHLRARRSMNEWKRIALMTLAAKLAEAALEASGRPYDEDGAAIVGEAIRRAHRTPIARRRDRITSEHLAEVARVYREAWEAGEHPTIAVQDHFGVSHSTAARWVGQARRANPPHLGRPAEGSRGGEDTA